MKQTVLSLKCEKLQYLSFATGHKRLKGCDESHNCRFITELLRWVLTYLQKQIFVLHKT
jgi:hypothetical protein